MAFFISNLGQGGAERQFVELIKGINKDVFEVSLFLYAYQKKAFYEEIFDVEDIKVHTNKLKFKNPVLKIIEALFYIRKVTNHNHFDLIFTSLFMNNLFVRIATSTFYRDKIIANSRNSILLYTKYHLFVEKKLIKKSYLVFNSKDALADFKKVIPLKYHNKLKVIYNGFKIESILTEERKVNRIVIGGLGRQSHQKNFVQLARVFKGIVKEKPFNSDLKLILQGKEGDETEEIKKQVEDDSTSIIIRDANPEIKLFFREIDIMVLPSHFEGCPNVLFEAMINKRLCIISKGANSDDFVIDGVNGFVYDGTDEGLTEVLKKAISVLGTEQEKQIVENAFQYVKESFSMEKMIKTYENLFLKIYEKNKTGNN